MEANPGAVGFFRIVVTSSRRSRLNYFIPPPSLVAVLTYAQINWSLLWKHSLFWNKSSKEDRWINSTWMVHVSSHDSHQGWVMLFVSFRELSSPKNGCHMWAHVPYCFFLENRQLCRCANWGRLSVQMQKKQHPASGSSRSSKAGEGSRKALATVRFSVCLSRPITTQIPTQSQLSDASYNIQEINE